LLPKRRARILSVGTAVPPQIVTNKDLEKVLDTSDEWIVSRTGIKQRHICPKDNSISASDLGAKAAQAALNRAGIDATHIDGIICATFTPDNFFPSTACRIQDNLGAKGAFAFDISAACAGFVYGLSIANAMIASGRYNRILLVGAEIISKTLDWTDRTTCILFGDAAGAVVLEATDDENTGVLSTYMSSDGSLGKILCLPAWGESRTMRMNGGEVFKNAVRMMSEAAHNVLKQAGLTLDEVHLMIPHQANIRIIKAVAENIGLPFDRVVCNVERFGNTSSASIPLALEEAWNQGRVKPGVNTVFVCLGGGIAIASAVVRF
jgi:3-oxoacyl-[acyl-carrier-protein] synthase-3